MIDSYICLGINWNGVDFDGMSFYADESTTPPRNPLFRDLFIVSLGPDRHKNIIVLGEDLIINQLTIAYLDTNLEKELLDWLLVFGELDISKVRVAFNNSERQLTCIFDTEEVTFGEVYIDDEKYVRLRDG